MSGTFIAKFTGTLCDWCEEKIREGEEVTYNADDRLMHARCPEPHDDTPRPVCGGCFMEMPVSGKCPDCS